MARRIHPDPFNPHEPHDSGLTGPLRNLSQTDKKAAHHIIAALRALTARGTEPDRETIDTAIRIGRQWYRDTGGRLPEGAMVLMTVEQASAEYGMYDTTIYRWIRDDRLCGYGTRPVLVNGAEVLELQALLHGRGD